MPGEGPSPKWNRSRLPDEPTQSDATLLLKLEDLIHIAVGRSDKNVINFKLFENILYILARYLRVLDQEVEISVGEITHKLVTEGPPQDLRGRFIEIMKARSPDDNGRKDRDSQGRRGKSFDRSGHTEESPEGRGYPSGGQGVKEGRGERDNDDEERRYPSKREKSEIREQEKEKNVKQGPPTSGGRNRDSEKEESTVYTIEEGKRIIDKDEAMKSTGGCKSSPADKEESYYEEREEQGYCKNKRESCPTSKNKGHDDENVKDRVYLREREEKGKKRREGEGQKEQKLSPSSSHKIRDDVSEEEPEYAGEEEQTRKGGEKGTPTTNKERLDNESTKQGEQAIEDKGRRKYFPTTKREVRDGESEQEKSYRAAIPTKRDKVKDSLNVGTGRKGKYVGNDKGRGKEVDAYKEGEEEESEDEKSTRDDGPRRKGANTVSRGKSEDEEKRTDEASGKEVNSYGIGRDEGSENKEERKPIAPKSSNGIRAASKSGGIITGKGENDDEYKDDKHQRKREKDSYKEQGKGESGSPPAPGIKSSKIGNDDVLGTSDRPTRIGSVDVVTQKQFEKLKDEVRDLQDKAKPLPPTLPENLTFKADITKGNVTVSATLKALRLSPRIEAAEETIKTMAEMLTRLASVGALPRDVAEQAEIIKINLEAVKHEMATGERLLITNMDEIPDYSRTTKRIPVGDDAVDRPIITSARGGDDGKGRGARGTDGKAGFEGPSLDDRPDSKRSGGQYTVGQRPIDGTERGRAVGPGPGVTIGMDKELFKEMGPGMGHRTSCVTQPELSAALKDLRESLLTNLLAMSNKAVREANTSSATFEYISKNMHIPVDLKSRISLLHSQMVNHLDKVQGFNDKLNNQMGGFKEQMDLLRSELGDGLTKLEKVNNSAEKSAERELSDRFEVLVSDLNNILHAHQALTAYQQQLNCDTKSISEAVHMMKESKAGREEILRGIEAKANISSLVGLLSDEEFLAAQRQLGAKMHLVYKKFHEQNHTWMRMLYDIVDKTQSKEELVHLISIQKNLQHQINNLHQKVRTLECIMGDPASEKVTRKLAKDSRCALCRIPALMIHEEPSYPVALPPACSSLPAPVAPDLNQHGVEPCLRSELRAKIEIKYRQAPHTCLRWVGGSHTLTTLTTAGRGKVDKDSALLQLARPVKKYLGAGTDGKIENLASEIFPHDKDMQPCKDCNVAESGSETAQGHTEVPPTT